MRPLPRPRLITFLGILIIAFVLFSRAFTYEYFIFDDGFHVWANPNLNPVSWASLKWIWTHSLTPVIYTFWATIAALSPVGTQSPFPFRFASLLLHAVNSYLVFTCLRNFLPIVCGLMDPQTPRAQNDTKEIDVASVVGAMIFLLHPVQVETIVWVSSAKDLLSFFFAILAFRYYLHLRTGKEEKRFAIGKTLLLNALVLAAAMCKISGAIILGVFFWLDISLFKRPVKRAFLNMLPLVAVGLVGILLLRQTLPISYQRIVPSWPWKFAIALDAVQFSFTKLLIPFNYHFDYGKTPASVMISYQRELGWNLIIAVSTLILVTVAALAIRVPKFKSAHFALVFILIALFPSLGFIPFVHQNISTVADRYLYLPSFGLSLGLALIFLHAYRRRKTFALGVSLMLLTLMGGITYFQVELWRDSATQINYALSDNPNSYVLHKSLSEVYLKQGKKQAAQEEGGLAEYLRAENQSP